jgi:hypothetical protein
MDAMEERTGLAKVLSSPWWIISLVGLALGALAIISLILRMYGTDVGAEGL